MDLPLQTIVMFGIIIQLPAVKVLALNLSCYQCIDNFHKKLWYPYTDCQKRPMALQMRVCGRSDRYCKVERVEWNGFLMTLERGCTEECYWGCRHEGFGITKYRCTSCCNTHDGCNTDNSAPGRTFRTRNVCVFMTTLSLIFSKLL